MRTPTGHRFPACAIVLLGALACQLPAREGHIRRTRAPDAAAAPDVDPDPVAEAPDAAPLERTLADAPDGGGSGTAEPDAGESDEDAPPEPAVELPALVVELGSVLVGRTARDASEAYLAGEFDEAAGLYDRLRRDLEPTAPGWYEASLLAGLAHLRGGAPALAVDRLRPLADADHPLRPFARLTLARAELAAEEPVRALRALEGTWEPPYAAEADRARAEALLAAGRPDDAVEAIEQSAATTRAEPAARLLLARATLEQAARAGAEPSAATLDRCRTALADLRVLRAERAGTDEGDEADRLLRLHISLLPRNERAALLDLTVSDRIALVRRLTAAYRYDTAQEQAEKLIEATAGEEQLGCPALQTAADAWYRARDYARAMQVLDQATAACAGRDEWPGVAFRAARARLNTDDDAGALALFEALERAAPHSPEAGDARLARARLALDAGDAATFESLLGGLAKDHPGIEQAEEATWRLGQYRLAAGRAAEAADDFAGLLRHGWTSPEPAQGGKARYWHGVALEAAGRADEATDEYRSVLRHDPLTFYGLLAYGRLRLRDAAAARALLDEALARGPDAAPARVDLPDLPIVRSEGFKRALAFLGLGLYDEAADEIAVLRAGPGVPAAAAAALGALAQRVGAYRLGLRLAGVSQSPLGREALTSRALRTWQLAYPRGFANTVGKAAEAQRLPDAFLFGVIHEESGFEPRAFSSAHAVGLMQLLVPTAERFADAAGVDGRVTRRRLNRPSINVPIGAAFLRFLADRYPDRLLLLPAAYNAGEGRLDRWLAAHGDLPLDAFVESIPFDSTRTYLMRVVSSWAVYQALYPQDPDDEPLPPIDPTVRAQP